MQRFERDDGTLIIYIDAGDIVVFVYAGRPTEASARAGGQRDAVVVDLHRRTEAGEQRLHVLVDGAPARLLRFDPAQFQVLTTADRRKRGLELVCVRCGSRVETVAHRFLHVLLEAAAAHSCPPGKGAESCG
ncbi:hypothetical protein ACGFIV_32380 [Sphaerisporangium sp. NPDC049003]|uniref:hypothetical protein n=1 Tax=Sphaerisporangium sp. NPDC049003 TaxID=3364517 RepID=UPI0037245D95